MHQLSAHTVFVADDDEDDLYLLRLAFQQQVPNCQLEVALDGASLLSQLEESNSHPCLIILDLNMPFMDGFEVLRTLRSNPAYEHTPIVVLTTSQYALDRQRAFDLGANAFITKPTNLTILNQTIQQLSQEWLFDKVL